MLETVKAYSPAVIGSHERRRFAKGRVLAFALSLVTACGSSGSGDNPVPPPIGPSGGTVSGPSGTSVQIPAGALSANTTITIAASTITAPSGAVTSVFEFGPAGTIFATPVTVSFTVPAGTTAANAAVYWTKPGSATQWDVLAATVSGTTATASVTHFSAGFVGAACTVGAACPPTNACHTGATTCNGTPACVDTGTSLSDGAACGGGNVCTAGVCGAGNCSAGQVCTPAGSADPCKTYATTCTGGVQACGVSGNSPDGTTCGSGLVCTAGACGSSGSGSYFQVDVVRVFRVTTTGSATYTYDDRPVTYTPPTWTRKSVSSNTTTYQLRSFVQSGGAMLQSGSETRLPDGTLTGTASFDPPELIFPANTAVGATASSTSTVTQTGAPTSTLTRSLTVNGVESVTVPAGTFSALKVTALISQSNASPATNVTWWVQGIGLVKSLSYPDSTPSNTTLFELTSYNSVVCTGGTCPLPTCVSGQACTPTGTSDACKAYATACDTSGAQTCVVASDRPDGTTCGGANTCAAGLCQAPCASATVKTPATGSPAWSADFASWMTANGFAHVAANQGFGGGTACGATGRDPVVLLHGNTIQADPTAGVVALKSKFVAGGYTDCDLFAITWIEQSAAQGDNHHKASYMKLVRDLVDAVKGYRGAAKVDVVAWSMGVGIARKAMQGGIAYSDTARTLGCDLGPSMSASVDTLVGVAGVARGYAGCTNTSNSCSPNGYSVDSSFLQDVNGGKAGTYAPAPVASHVYSIYLPDDEFLCGDNPLGRGPIACEVYGTHSSIVPGSEFSRAYDLFNENYGNNFGLNFNCTTDAFAKAVNCDHILVMNDAFSLDAIVRMVRDNETATLPPPPFAQADLAGAWDIVVHTSNDAAIWQAASVTIDGGGLMTFTSYVDSIGTTTVPGPSQTFIIDANGIVTTTGAGAVPSLHGMLSAQKTLLVGTMTFPGTPSSYGLFVLRKRVNGVTFSSADVANLAFDFHQILSGGGTVWEYGLGSTNTAGALTIASVMTPTGPGTPPSAGSDTLQISPAGLVTMATDTTFHGVMTADKKAVFGVGTRSGTIPSPYFTTLLLTGQSFAQADLNAVWEFHLLTSGANLAASNWFYGRVSIVSPGTVTTRYGLAPSGATLPAVGPLNLAPDGTITSSGNATYHGRMSWGKDFYVRTQTTSGASSLSLAVK